MNTREYFKMQSINFCYMSFMLKMSNSDTLKMKTKHITELFMDEDAICALMSDGEVILAIDLEPDISTQAIQEWIGMNPLLHEKVIALMETQ